MNMNIADMHVTVSPAVRAKMEERKIKNTNRQEKELSCIQACFGQIYQ